MWDKGKKHTRIKLCEFETLDVSYEASQLDVDALGFHYFTHHSFDERLARFSEIFRFLPSYVEKVLLTDLPLDLIVGFCKLLPVNTIQLYPDWKIEEIQKLRNLLPGVKILKVMSAKSEENSVQSSEEFLSYFGNVADAFLLDSFRRGGTGQVADWDHCANIVKLSPLPVFLAGGLTSANVEQAIKIIRPFGVDVETGVSDRIPNGPLVKNLLKCRDFVNAVKMADRKPTSDSNLLERFRVCGK